MENIENSEVVGVSNTPEVSEVAENSEVVETSNVPEVVETSNVPEVVETSNVPEVVEVPEELIVDVQETQNEEETQEPQETQEPNNQDMHQLDQDSVFLLQKFMMENAMVEKKLRDLAPLEESRFCTVGDKAYFADSKKPVLAANYHFIGEYQKISTGGDDEENPIYVFRWAWSATEDLEALKAVKVMENSFDKLPVFNSPQISFQDEMLLNVISAYSADRMHLDYICRFYDPNNKVFIIFGFSNLVWDNLEMPKVEN